MEAERSMQVYLDENILRTFMLLVQTSDKVVRYANARLNRAGLSLIKFTLLHTLAANGGTMTPSQIAERTFRTRHDITTLVDRLERDGFVTTERQKRDKRYINVTLTDKARQLLPQARTAGREIAGQVMGSTTEADAALLEKLLGTLRQNAHDGLEDCAKHSQRQAN